MATKLFTKIHLLQALKAEGLPATYKSLLKLEEEGVIRAAFDRLNTQRLYTESEIREVVAKVKAYKEDEKK